MYKTKQKPNLFEKFDAHKMFQTSRYENENSIQKANNVNILFRFLQLLLSTKQASRSSQIRSNIFALIFAYSLWCPLQQSQLSGRSLLTNFSSNFCSSLTTICRLFISGNKIRKFSAWALLFSTLSYTLNTTGPFLPVAGSRIFKMFCYTVQQQHYVKQTFKTTLHLFQRNSLSKMTLK